MRAIEYVGKAEKIKSRELAAQRAVENYRAQKMSISSSLENKYARLDSLRASLDAAQSQEDDDGNRDESLIESIESSISGVEYAIDELESEKASVERDLDEAKDELEAAKTEKEVTLFEIQEKAEKKAKNISIAQSIIGTFVSSSLQDAMQNSLASYAAAAKILGGSISTSISGGGGGFGNSSTHSGGTISSGLNDSYQSGSFGTGGSSYDAQNSNSSASASQYVSSQSSSYVATGNSQVDNGVSLKSIDDYTSRQTSGGDLHNSLDNDSNASASASSSTASDYCSQQTSDHSVDTKIDFSNQFEWNADANSSAKGALAEYMSSHGYGESDFATYFQDPEWKQLFSEAFPDYNSTDFAKMELSAYMSAKDYHRSEYSEYSRDPKWKELFAKAYLEGNDVGKCFQKSADSHKASQCRMSIVGKSINRITPIVESNSKHMGDDNVNQLIQIKTPVLAHYVKGELNSINNEHHSKYSTYKNTSVNSLLKDNLDSIINYAIFQLQYEYKDRISIDKIDALKKSIHFEQRDPLKRGAAGLYDLNTKQITIYLDNNPSVEYLLATIEHEALHMLSAKSLNRSGVSGEGYFKYGNNGMNEGITELFAVRSIKKINPNYTNIAYPDLVEVMEKYQQVYGNKDFENVYFTGHLLEFETDFNEYVEGVSFENFCNTMDFMLRKYEIYNTTEDPIERVRCKTYLIKAKQELLQVLDAYEKAKKTNTRAKISPIVSSRQNSSLSNDTYNYTSARLFTRKDNRKEGKTYSDNNTNNQDKKKRFLDDISYPVSDEDIANIVKHFTDSNNSINKKSDDDDERVRERDIWDER